MDIGSKFQYHVVTTTWEMLDIEILNLSLAGFRVISVVSNTIDISHFISVNSSYDTVSGLMKDTPIATNSMPMLEYKIIGEKEIF